VATKDRPAPPRYLAIRISKRQGRLFADGGEVKHFAIVTNLPDPEGGSGLDLIRWHRAKAGTVEHAHHVLTNELAAEALPSQKFAANAAWFRLNVLLFICSPPSSASRCLRSCTPPARSGCASCSSTPSARSCAMPARRSCA
jgi:hypothetical protein